MCGRCLEDMEEKNGKCVASGEHSDVLMEERNGKCVASGEHSDVLMEERNGKRVR